MQNRKNKSFLEKILQGFYNRNVEKKTINTLSLIEKNLLLKKHSANNIDINQSITTKSKSKPITVKIKRILSFFTDALQYNNYYESEHDFDRILNIYLKETYMMRAVNYYIDTVLKEQYTIVGNDNKFIDYIVRRFKEAELVTDIPLDDILRQSLLCLILYGNVIITKKRNSKASSGNKYKRFDGKTFSPVAGYFVEDPTSITIRKEKSKIIYTRKINNRHYNKSYMNGYYSNFYNEIDKDKDFDKEDVIHIKYNCIPGNMWGTPPLIGVLDDLVTLRAIEECVYLLIYQYGSPFYHFKVGTDKIQGKLEEINSLKDEVQAMEGNSSLITASNVEVKNVTSNNGNIDMSKYLEYFKQRVFSGLNVDGNIMGEGQTANKDSSNIIQKTKISTVISYQKYIKEMLKQMIQDMKYEFGIKPKDYFDYKYEIDVSFPEVDLSSKIAIQNHYLNVFVQGGITRAELREHLGKKKLTNQEMKDTFSEIMNNTKEVEKKQEGSNNKTKNEITPSNQYGKKTTAEPSKN